MQLTTLREKLSDVEELIENANQTFYECQDESYTRKVYNKAETNLTHLYSSLQNYVDFLDVVQVDDVANEHVHDISRHLSSIYQSRHDMAGATVLEISGIPDTNDVPVSDILQSYVYCSTDPRCLMDTFITGLKTIDPDYDMSKVAPKTAIQKVRDIAIKYRWSEIVEEETSNPLRDKVNAKMKIIESLNCNYTPDAYAFSVDSDGAVRLNVFDWKFTKVMSQVFTTLSKYYGAFQDYLEKDSEARITIHMVQFSDSMAGLSIYSLDVGLMSYDDHKVFVSEATKGVTAQIREKIKPYLPRLGSASLSISPLCKAVIEMMQNEKGFELFAGEYNERLHFPSIKNKNIFTYHKESCEMVLQIISGFPDVGYATKDELSFFMVFHKGFFMKDMSADECYNFWAYTLDFKSLLMKKKLLMKPLFECFAKGMGVQDRTVAHMIEELERILKLLEKHAPEEIIKDFRDNILPEKVLKNEVAKDFYTSFQTSLNKLRPKYGDFITRDPDRLGSDHPIVWAEQDRDLNESMVRDVHGETLEETITRRFSTLCSSNSENFIMISKPNSAEAWKRARNATNSMNGLFDIFDTGSLKEKVLLNSIPEFEFTEDNKVELKKGSVFKRKFKLTEDKILSRPGNEFSFDLSLDKARESGEVIYSQETQDLFNARKISMKKIYDYAHVSHKLSVDEKVKKEKIAMPFNQALKKIPVANDPNVPYDTSPVIESFQEAFAARNINEYIAEWDCPTLLNSYNVKRAAFENAMMKNYSYSKGATKVEKLVDVYMSQSKRLGLPASSESRTKLILNMMEETNVLRHADDMHTLMKGVMVASKFTAKNSLKVITCANPNVIAVAMNGMSYLDKNSDGIPFFTCTLVPTEAEVNHEACYSNELLCKKRVEFGYTLYVSVCYRYNLDRMVSLFKSPAKVMVSFAFYMEQMINNSFTDKEKRALIVQYSKRVAGEEWIKLIPMNIRPGIISHIKKAIFSSMFISNVTRLTRMGIVDFMRYAASLPLGTYSNIHGFIEEKLDLRLTTLFDFGMMNSICSMLEANAAVDLEKNIKKIRILDEGIADGGVTSLELICPMTGSKLSKPAELFNSIFLAIYMMPKSLHNHIHNLLSLVMVPVDWECKFRDEHGFNFSENVKPKKAMFSGKGNFSINVPIFLLSSNIYLKRYINSIAKIRTGLEKEEKLFMPVDHIPTMSSTKKCSEMDREASEGTFSVITKLQETFFGTESIEPEDFRPFVRGLNRHDKICLECMVTGKAAEIFDSNRVWGVTTDRILQRIISLCLVDKSCADLLMGRKLNLSKTDLKRNLDEQTAYLSIRLRINDEKKKYNVISLRSRKVSDAMFGLVLKKYSNPSLETVINNMDKMSGQTSVLDLIERHRQEVHYFRDNHMSNVYNFCSIFEKHQRTMTDREIYLSTVQTKIDLYYMDHIFKHVGKVDNSEAISVPGTYKLQGLARMGTTQSKAVSEALKAGLNVKDTHLSLDQSKWSASDMSWKFVMFVIMCPFLAFSEQAVFSDMLCEYMKKKLVIPVDVFSIMAKSRKDCITEEDKKDNLWRITKGMTTNALNISMNWLQGNFNYMSSVLHSVAMIGYKLCLDSFYSKSLVLQRHMVHSDDNLTSIVVTTSQENMVPGVIEDLSNFHVVVYHLLATCLKTFCITLNEKKSYSSPTDAEFISEHLINNEPVPLYSRHLANCCTESSHLSYYDDISSIGTQIVDAIRKGVPQPLIPFMYCASSYQALSIYSMLPGEENDAAKIWGCNPLDIPIIAGGWLSLDAEMLALGGVSYNDPYLAMTTLAKESSMSVSAFIENMANEGSSKMANWVSSKLREGSNSLKILACLHLMNKKDSEESLLNDPVGSKSSSFLRQPFRLPTYSSEFLLNKLASFSCFAEYLPSLKKKEGLLMMRNIVEFGNVHRTEDPESLIIEERCGKDMTKLEKLYNALLSRPHIMVSSTNTDGEYILQACSSYLNLKYREMITQPDTIVIAMDRILKAKATMFRNPFNTPRSEMSKSDPFRFSWNGAWIKSIAESERITKNWSSNGPPLIEFCRFVSEFCMSNIRLCRDAIITTTKTVIETTSNSTLKLIRVVPEAIQRVINSSPGLVTLAISRPIGCLVTTDMGYVLPGEVEEASRVLTSYLGENKMADFIKKGQTGLSTIKSKVDYMALILEVSNTLMTINLSLERKPYFIYSKLYSKNSLMSGQISLLSQIQSYSTEKVVIISSTPWLEKNSRVVKMKSKERTENEVAMNAVGYICKTLEDLSDNQISNEQVLSVLDSYLFNGKSILQITRNMIFSSIDQRYRNSNPFRARGTGALLLQQGPTLCNLNLVDPRHLKYCMQTEDFSKPRFVYPQRVDADYSYVGKTMIRQAGEGKFITIDATEDINKCTIRIHASSQNLHNPAQLSLIKGLMVDSMKFYVQTMKNAPLSIPKKDDVDEWSVYLVRKLSGAVVVGATTIDKALRVEGLIFKKSVLSDFSQSLFMDVLDKRAVDRIRPRNIGETITEVHCVPTRQMTDAVESIRRMLISMEGTSQETIDAMATNDFVTLHKIQEELAFTPTSEVRARLMDLYNTIANLKAVLPKSKNSHASVLSDLTCERQVFLRDFNVTRCMKILAEILMTPSRAYQISLFNLKDIFSTDPKIGSKIGYPPKNFIKGLYFSLDHEGSLVDYYSRNDSGELATWKEFVMKSSERKVTLDLDVEDVLVDPVLLSNLQTNISNATYEDDILKIQLNEPARTKIPMDTREKILSETKYSVSANLNSMNRMELLIMKLTELVKLSMPVLRNKEYTLLLLDGPAEIKRDSMNITLKYCLMYAVFEKMGKIIPDPTWETKSGILGEIISGLRALVKLVFQTNTKDFISNATLKNFTSYALYEREIVSSGNKDDQRITRNRLAREGKIEYVSYGAFIQKIQQVNTLQDLKPFFKDFLKPIVASMTETPERSAINDELRSMMSSMRNLGLRFQQAIEVEIPKEIDFFESIDLDDD